MNRTGLLGELLMLSMVLVIFAVAGYLWRGWDGAGTALLAAGAVVSAGMIGRWMRYRRMTGGR